MYKALGGLPTSSHFESVHRNVIKRTAETDRPLPPQERVLHRMRQVLLRENLTYKWVHAEDAAAPTPTTPPTASRAVRPVRHSAQLLSTVAGLMPPLLGIDLNDVIDLIRGKAGLEFDPDRGVVYDCVTIPGRFYDGIRGKFVLKNLIPRSKVPPTHSAEQMYDESGVVKVGVCPVSSTHAGVAHPSPPHTRSVARTCRPVCGLIARQSVRQYVEPR